MLAAYLASIIQNPLWVNSKNYLHFSFSSLCSLILFFFLVGVADLQRHLPAVLEGSGKGVGCAGMGRSVPTGLLLPLGGALSPHWWWWQEPMPRWGPTGHCADAPVWKDTDTHGQRRR